VGQRAALAKWFGWEPGSPVIQTFAEVRFKDGARQDLSLNILLL
jgi:hypothetical protein